MRFTVHLLMQNIQILFQNQEISQSEKTNLCRIVKNALQTGDASEAYAIFKTLRFNTAFPDVVEQCMQLTYPIS